MTHAEMTLVLVLGVAVLSAGSVSMLVVRLTNPGLRGVGWFGASFAAGTLGTALQMAPAFPVLQALGTDLALLAAFVLMHVAVLQIAHNRSARLWHGLFLMGVQAALDVYCLSGVPDQRLRVASLGILVAIQAMTTLTTLMPLLRGALRAPAAYCVVLLAGFSATSFIRSAILLSARGSLELNHRLGLLAFLSFLAVELGIAFGFFWMTTANLTSQVEKVASTDPLTRLFNRRVFLRWCEKELLRSQRSGVPFSLLMVDLDHFKSVNDNFGHQRGDEVLVAAVERMQDSVRGIDVLCRWGGEEFAVLLPNAPIEATRIVAERIREAISRMKIPLQAEDSSGASPEHLTASIGAATYRDVDDDLAAMLLRADRALYRAKGSGRNQVLIGA